MNQHIIFISTKSFKLNIFKILLDTIHIILTHCIGSTASSVKFILVHGTKAISFATNCVGVISAVVDFVIVDGSRITRIGCSTRIENMITATIIFSDWFLSFPKTQCWQWCWWLKFGDDLWLPNFDIGDILYFSLTNFVFNIRHNWTHQHRCNPLEPFIV